MSSSDDIHSSAALLLWPVKDFRSSQNCLSNCIGKLEEQNSVSAPLHSSFIDNQNRSTRNNQISAICRSNGQRSSFEGLIKSASNTISEQQVAKAPSGKLTNTAATRLSWCRKVVDGGGGARLVWPTTGGKGRDSVSNKSDAPISGNKSSGEIGCGLGKKWKRSNNKASGGSMIVQASNNFVDKLTCILKNTTSTFMGTTLTRSEKRHHEPDDISRVQQEARRVTSEGCEGKLIEGGGKRGEGVKAIESREKESGGFSSVLRGRRLAGGGGSSGVNCSSIANGGSSYLISGLSWRLVKRCSSSSSGSRQDNKSRQASKISGSSSSSETNTVSNKAVQFSESARGKQAPRNLTTSGSKATVAAHCQANEPLPLQTTGEDGDRQSVNLKATAQMIHEQEQPQQSEHLSLVVKRQSRATSDGTTASTTAFAPTSTERAAATSTNSSSSSMATTLSGNNGLFIGEQQQQQQPLRERAEEKTGANAQQVVASTASNITTASNINSSISTLSTSATPTGCYYCDESASSGFISQGINCSDSILTTSNSCASSTYNDQQLVLQPLSRESDSQTYRQQPARITCPASLTACQQSAVIASDQSANNPKSLSASQQQQQQVTLANMTTTILIDDSSQLKPVGVQTGNHDQAQAHQVAEGGKQQTLLGEIGKQEQSGRRAKKGGSFLSRARDSTINLAALATKTQKFNCSASVGNLWSLHGAVHQQRRELAELSGDSPNSVCRPLDYTPRGAFDTDLDQNNNNNNTNNAAKSNGEPNKGDAAGGQDPKQAQKPGSRKSSTSSEKKRRQKEAEKVEKLRLLVSYLKSGASQQLVNPIALEPDELELAEDYKHHLMSCATSLSGTGGGGGGGRGGGSGDGHGQTPARSSSRSHPISSWLLRGSISNPEIGSQQRRPSDLVGSIDDHFLAVCGTDIADGASVAGSFSGSSGAGGSVPAGSIVGASSGAYRQAADQPSSKLFYIDDMERKDSDSSDTNSQIAGCVANQHNQFANGTGCANNPYHHHTHHHIHYQGGDKGRQRSSKAIISSSDAIRDMPTRNWSSKLFLSSTPTIATTDSTNTTTTTSGQPMSAGQASNLDPNLPSYSNNSNNNSNSNSPGPHMAEQQQQHQQIETSNGQAMPMASKTSAWTNPQNLATWIDNEVNSLLSDLEAQNRLVKDDEKQVKNSKRKWLSSSS